MTDDGRCVVSGHIEEAIAQAELMLCPKGLPHTGENNRAEHGHTECWAIGELLNEIERLRAEKAELIEAIRLTAEYFLPPARDNWEWWKAYGKYADHDDAQRMKDYCDRANGQVVDGD